MQNHQRATLWESSLSTFLFKVEMERTNERRNAKAQLPYSTAFCISKVFVKIHLCIELNSKRICVGFLPYMREGIWYISSALNSTSHSTTMVFSLYVSFCLKYDFNLNSSKVRRDLIHSTYSRNLVIIRCDWFYFYSIFLEHHRFQHIVYNLECGRGMENLICNSSQLVCIDIKQRWSTVNVFVYEKCKHYIKASRISSGISHAYAYTHMNIWMMLEFAMVHIWPIQLDVFFPSNIEPKPST